MRAIVEEQGEMIQAAVIVLQHGPRWLRSRRFPWGGPLCPPTLPTGTGGAGYPDLIDCYSLIRINVNLRLILTTDQYPWPLAVFLPPNNFQCPNSIARYLIAMRAIIIQRQLALAVISQDHYRLGSVSRAVSARRSPQLLADVDCPSRCNSRAGQSDCPVLRGDLFTPVATGITGQDAAASGKQKYQPDELPQ
jgi:hypothetical protein